MTVRKSFQQNLAAGLSAEDERLISNVFTPGPGTGLHALGGILPAPAGFVAEVIVNSDTSATINPFRALVPGTQGLLQGDYVIASDTSVTLVIDPRQAGLTRLDALVTSVRDTQYVPNEGIDDVTPPRIIKGAAVASGPALPTIPANSILHGYFTVPATGAGAVTYTPAVRTDPISLAAAPGAYGGRFDVPVGAIRPTDSADTRAGSYGGQHKWDLDSGTQEWDGSRWTRHGRTLAASNTFPAYARRGDLFYHSLAKTEFVMGDDLQWQQISTPVFRDFANPTAIINLYPVIRDLPGGWRVHLTDPTPIAGGAARSPAGLFRYDATLLKPYWRRIDGAVAPLVLGILDPAIAWRTAVNSANTNGSSAELSSGIANLCIFTLPDLGYIYRPSGGIAWEGGWGASGARWDCATYVRGTKMGDSDTTVTDTLVDYREPSAGLDTFVFTKVPPTTPSVAVYGVSFLRFIISRTYGTLNYTFGGFGRWASAVGYPG